MSNFSSPQMTNNRRTRYRLSKPGRLSLLSAIILLCAVSGLLLSGCGGGGTDRDREALVALYNATDGPNWRFNTNWLSDAPSWEWGGVSVGNGDRVTKLDLSHRELRGEIPPELGNLDKLEWLDLTGNELIGVIPPTLGNLANLERLALSDNELNGMIPVELGSLHKLESLNLSMNELTGGIPPELGNLGQMVSLSLGENDLTGKIPAELGNLVNLEHLGLSENELSGDIPAEIRNLSKLCSLRLTGNELSGCIPGILRFPLLAGHNVDGRDRVDFRIEREANLRGFPFCGWANSKTQLEGDSWSDREALVAIYNATGGPDWTIKKNWLSDVPLDEWYGVTVDYDGRVAALQLRWNKLTGEIPPELGNLTSLQVLELNGALTGEIPPELGNLTSLQVLELNGVLSVDREDTGGVRQTD